MMPKLVSARPVARWLLVVGKGSPALLLGREPNYLMTGAAGINTIKKMKKTKCVVSYPLRSSFLKILVSFQTQEPPF